jgi:hypothetical protein
MPINNLQKEPWESVKRKIDGADGSQRSNQRLQLAISTFEREKKKGKEKKVVTSSVLGVIFSGTLKQNT